MCRVRAAISIRAVRGRVVRRCVVGVVIRITSETTLISLVSLRCGERSVLVFILIVEQGRFATHIVRGNQVVRLVFFTQARGENAMASQRFRGTGRTRGMCCSSFAVCIALVGLVALTALVTCLILFIPAQHLVHLANQLRLRVSIAERTGLIIILHNVHIIRNGLSILKQTRPARILKLQRIP